MTPEWVAFVFGFSVGSSSGFVLALVISDRTRGR